MGQASTGGNRITLVGVDYSDDSRVALTTAAAIVQASPGAELHVLHVVSVPHLARAGEGGELRAILYPNTGGEFSASLSLMREEAHRLLPQFCASVTMDLATRVVQHVRFGRRDRQRREFTRHGETLDRFGEA